MARRTHDLPLAPPPSIAKSPDGPAMPKRASVSVTTAGGGAVALARRGLDVRSRVERDRRRGQLLAHARRASGRGVDDGIGVGGDGGQVGFVRAIGGDGAR